MTAGRSAGSPGSSDRRGPSPRCIGREPFTDFHVAVRCPHGGPAVVRNAPVDLRGRPFPTRDWLTCRALGEAVSRLEAAGGVRMLEDDPDDARAPGRGATPATRSCTRATGWPAAATPTHVKCLHAHLAFGLGEGGSPVADWIMERADARWPAALLRRAAARGARRERRPGRSPRHASRGTRASRGSRQPAPAGGGRRARRRIIAAVHDELRRRLGMTFTPASSWRASTTRRPSWYLDLAARTAPRGARRLGPRRHARRGLRRPTPAAPRTRAGEHRAPARPPPAPPAAQAQDPARRWRCC